MNDKIIIDSREVAEMIKKEHKHLRESIKKYIRRLKLHDVISEYFIDSTYINSQNKIQPCYIITLKGVRYLIDNLQKYSKLEPLIMWYGIHKNTEIETIIIKDRQEIEFINKLEQSLSPFNVNGIRQYRVLTYRIDYYIPELNIAIEYDENEHKNYTYKEHEGRQKDIEKELGCRFIRVSDKNSDEYNIGLVLKESFKMAS